MDFIMGIMDKARPMNILPVHPLSEIVLVSFISAVLLLTIVICWGELASRLRTKRKATEKSIPMTGSNLGRPSPKPPVRKPVIQVYPAFPRVSSPRRKTGNKITVRASTLPYHRERGWAKKGRLLKGYYRTKFGSFRGEIELRPGGEHKFFIYNPPETVLSGPHAACFNKAGITEGGYKYSIHFRVHAKDTDSGIMAVERTIYESFKIGVLS